MSKHKTLVFPLPLFLFSSFVFYSQKFYSSILMYDNSLGFLWQTTQWKKNPQYVSSSFDTSFNNFNQFLSAETTLIETLWINQEPYMYLQWIKIPNLKWEILRMPAFIYEISDYEILIATLSKVLVTRHEYLTILILYSIKFISLYLPMLYYYQYHLNF